MVLPVFFSHKNALGSGNLSLMLFMDIWKIVIRTVLRMPYPIQYVKVDGKSTRFPHHSAGDLKELYPSLARQPHFKTWGHRPRT